MNAITSDLCRLCLKESFILHNIYSSRTTSGDLVYRVLNYVYDLEIIPDDGLLTQICAPCMWKMLEFEGYKRNVHFARVEIVKLLSKIRPASTGGCGCRESDERTIESDSVQEMLPRENIEPKQEEVELMVDIVAEKQDSINRKDEENDDSSVEFDSTQMSNNGVSSKKGRNTDYMKAQDNQMNRASEDQDFEHGEHDNDMVPIKEELDIVESEIPGEIVLQDEPSEVEVAMEQGPVNSEVSINEEMDIVEWDMPAETVLKVPEALQHFQEAEEDDYNDIESDDMEPLKLPEDEYEEKCSEQVLSQPLQESTESSDLKNCLSLEASEETVGDSIEGESSSICTSQDIYGKNRVTNKGMPENGLRGDAVPVDESLSTQISKSILNVSKSGRSNLKASLIKRKSEFICDICKKSFQCKVHLGKHVRVHYDDRPFSCSVCDKRFKQDSVRCRHELLHLRDKMSLGKSEKGGKKILFSCSICGKKFGSKKGLNGHSNTHSGKFKCNFCGKCFGYNSDLMFHSRIHTKEKPFECKVCLKCFNRKDSLNTHILSHSSDKPFPCDICEKTFKTKGGKTQHALYHLSK